MHHIVEVDLSLKTVEYIVFDEADRYMRDCGSATDSSACWKWVSMIN